MLRYLQTFIAAARTSSFSAAGARLGLTQSAVSTQIRRLEEDLGCQLFDRAGKSVRLSERGRQLLPEAEQIVQRYERMRGASRQPAPATLAVGSISTAQVGLLPGALRRFRQACPAVHVNVVPGMSTQLLAQVDEEELDLAVLIKPNLNLPRHLKWVLLMRERYIGIAPRASRGDWADVTAALPFIRYNRKSHGGHLVDQFLHRHASQVDEFMELDEPAVILRMVREGLGCAIIPGALVDAAGDPQVRIVELPGPPFFREIGVVTRPTATKDAVLGTLIESLRTQAAALDTVG
ncbi:MAG: LysR family transcriptional regulator [Pigmentiphaga sp.]|nr:LysR family transcriptional regulator [Pigmentiphaga sp.]